MVGVPAPREPVEGLSAVTLLTADMARSVAFYRALGFHQIFGGPEATFTSLRAGAAFLNLQLEPGRPASGPMVSRLTHPGARGISTSAIPTVTS